MLKLFGDSTKYEFSTTKTDKEGKRLNPKHVYGNPLIPALNHDLAMALHFASHCELDENSNCIFGGGSANTTYDAKLKKTLAAHPDVVSQYGGGKFGTHSLRKGASTTAASGSTAGAPIMSIIQRGDWSCGVFDRYMKHMDAGDQYAGRQIALFDVHSAEFKQLPAHFVQLDAGAAKIVDDAIYFVFGSTENSIPVRHPLSKPLLARALAALVHHEEYLRATLPANHKAFSAIRLYREPGLIEKLKPLVTLGENGGPGTYLKPTGIPPHVDNIIRMEKMIATQQTIIDLQHKTLETLKDTVSSTIEQTITTVLESRAAENGVITTMVLRDALDRTRRADDNIVTEGLKAQLEELRSLIQSTSRPLSTSATTNPATPPPTTTEPFTFNYDGKLWDLPKDYVLPLNSTDKSTAIQFWLLGDKGRGIGPWCNIKKARTSKKQWGQLTLVKATFKFFELGLTQAVPSLPNRTNEYLKQYDQDVTALLKDRVAFLFCGSHKVATMKLTTWNKMVKPATIRKKGTSADKRKLADDDRVCKRHRPSAPTVAASDNVPAIAANAIGTVEGNPTVNPMVGSATANTAATGSFAAAGGLLAQLMPSFINRAQRIHQANENARGTSDEQDMSGASSSSTA